MYKVFLVEDEIIVRDGLKSIIPWQQYGFTLVGDAPDGEAALPRIRQTHPDVLITDIRMPFMDGLALSRIVRSEFPNIHIMIASGYDAFEYARQAISLGVEQYLLKPITKAALLDALTEMRQKLDAEQARAGYYEQFRREAHEYEQFARRRFFEELVAGHMEVQEIYSRAAKLDLDITSSQYNIVQFLMQRGDDDGYFEPLTSLQESITDALESCPEYLLFRWNLTTFAVLVKGGEDAAELTARCVDIVTRRCETADRTIQWYVASGEPVSRLSQLPQCFAAVSRMLACRFMLPDRHNLTGAGTLLADTADTEHKLRTVDASTLDPSRVAVLLKTAVPDEVEDFVNEYLAGIEPDALKSMLFCQYILLNIRFTATSFVEGLGRDKDELLDAVSELPPVTQIQSQAEVHHYVSALLHRAVELREAGAAGRYRGLMKQTQEYIAAHYTNENLSLNEVAQAVNLSACYFSALFSQEVGKTFTEYVTEKRMEKACALLREGELRSSEIAFAVGYKDPHYFSYLFKKTRGMTPRDYRAASQEGTV